MRTHKIAVIPGDGIGTEVVAAVDAPYRLDVLVSDEKKEEAIPQAWAGGKGIRRVVRDLGVGVGTVRMVKS